MNELLDFRTGIRESLPTVFGFIGISAAFGMIAKTAGLNIFLVVAISAIVFAGASQFAMISMLAAHNSVGAIALAVFLINSRFILASVTVAPYFKEESYLRNALIGTYLTDESFALGVNKLNFTGQKLTFEWYHAANLVAYFAWVFGTLLGALLSGLITDPQKLGLGFAITAMFIGLVYFQLESDKGLSFKHQLAVIIFVFVAMYFGLIFISPHMIILFVTILACFFGMGVNRAFK
ncbi:AzlC family ABC transporter permease [Eupransor demetentiae]|uniref:Predicted branched-chain amino acid permease (Azaleucine resistance) (AzlC) n=1 Tax=Eupransor demetentiae TaxID=3109584 RepID=A0ABP0EQE0_9LACO|nr:Predicted branched-chain amino acid permease (azaleucine resistance) (AzlC) [Lactobacillaceae bacterium LMG 33000]